MRLLRITAGMLIGAVVTAGVVLLFTPQSGADTRRLIQERIDAIRAEGQEAAEMRRQELVTRFEALKQPSPPAQQL